MSNNNSQVTVRLQLLGRQLFGQQARQAGKSLGSIGDAGSHAAAGISRGTRAISGMLDPLRRLAQAGAAAGGLGLGATIRASANFEQSMAVVNSKLLTSKANMNALTREALNLGAKTNYSANEVAGAMGELAAQGFGAQRILKTLPGTLSLAAASGADLAQSAEIQTETLHGFGLAAGKAGMVADVLAQIANKSAADINDMQEALKYIAPVAKASGQNLNDMGAAIGLMANVGIKGSQAGTTLRTAMVRLANPTQRARGALSTLHLAAGDLVGKKGLLTLPNIMAKVAAGAKGVSKNQRNAALATIFGREALSGMVALVEKGPAKITRMSNALRDSAGAAKRAADIQRNTVKGAFDNLTGSVESASIALTKRYMPAIKDALNHGAGLVNRGATKAQSFLTGVTTGRSGSRVRRVREGNGRLVATTVSGSATQAAGARVRGLADSAIGTVRKALPAVKNVVGQVLAALKPATPFLKNVLLPLLVGLGKGVLGSVVGAFKVALPLIRVLAGVLGAVGKAAAPFRGVIEGIGTVVGFLASGPILKLLSAVPKVGLVFRIAAGPVRLLSGVVRTGARVVGLLAGAFGRALQFVSRFAGTLSGAPRKVVLAATNMIGGIITTVERLPGKVAATAGRTVSRLASKLGDGAGKVLSSAGRLGSGIVGAIVDAIKSAPGAILNALGSLVDRIPAPGFLKKRLKSALGLHANGGVVRTPLQIVGERGPELAALPLGTRIQTAAKTRSLLGSAGGQRVMAAPTIVHVYPVIPVRVDVEGRELARAHFHAERQIHEAR